MLYNSKNNQKEITKKNSWQIIDFNKLLSSPAIPLAWLIYIILSFVIVKRRLYTYKVE